MRWHRKEDLGRHRSVYSKGCTSGGRLLLGPPNSTNSLILNFPIICKKIERGENVFYLDSTKLAQYFDLKKVDIDNLSTALCDDVVRPEDRRSPAVKVDPVKRALEYKSLLDNGTVKNQAELAVHLGTSRARVSKALNIPKKPED